MLDPEVRVARTMDSGAQPVDERCLAGQRGGAARGPEGAVWIRAVGCFGRGF